MRHGKFFSALLTLVIALWLQFSFLAYVRWSPDFVLTALVAFAFYFGFWELAALSTLSAFVLNWQPAFGLEIALIVLLPLAAFFVKRFLPWRNGINNLAAASAAILVFYGATNYSSLAGHALLFAAAAFGALCFGAFVFQIFNYFYGIKSV